MSKAPATVAVIYCAEYGFADRLSQTIARWGPSPNPLRSKALPSDLIPMTWGRSSCAPKKDVDCTFVCLHHREAMYFKEGQSPKEAGSILCLTSFM